MSADWSEIWRAVNPPAPRRRRSAPMWLTPDKPAGSIHCPPRAKVATATIGAAWSSFRISVSPFGKVSFRGPAAVAVRAAPGAGQPWLHRSTIAGIADWDGPPVAPSGGTPEEEAPGEANGPGA